MNDIDISAFDCIVENLEKALNSFLNAFAKVIKNISQKIQEAMKEIAPAFSFSLQLAAAVQRYPNRRIAWLALHHRKSRTRKKNLHRIFDWALKGGVIT